MKIYISGLARVMSCAGSLFFTDLPVDEDRTKRDEGEAAGEWLERLLTDAVVGVTHAKNGVLFDDDMKLFGKLIAENVTSLAQTKVECEKVVNWTTRCGVEIRGRLDISFEADGKLYIDDYKYGHGLVEVSKNWQLIGYAVGEVIRRNKAYTSIVLRIHQPRAHHEDGITRHWEISYDELLNYKEQIEQRMAAIKEGEKTLQTSSNCKYCLAATKCPAFGKAYHRGVEVVHDFIQDTLSDEELGFQLELVERIEELVKTRKSSLELLAINRIKDGKIIPKYAVIETIGHRQWKPTVTPEVVKMLTGKDILKQVMLSPNEAKKIGLNEEFISSMVVRPITGKKVKRCDTTALGNKIFGVPSVNG